MHLKSLRLIPLVVLMIGSGALAHAQGSASTAPITGTVVDAQGGVIPGASITITNEGTGAKYSTTTNPQGAFTVPALQPGTYTVTVSLTGFKTAVLKGVKLLAATPASVRATLEVGGLEDTVVVEAAGSLVQTQATAVSTTVEVAQINNLPVQSRNALDFLTLLPGVLTASTNRNSIVSGLDQSAINITIDGMSVQDNYLKTTDGYFARLSPRLDAVEEVTMTTAGGGAEAASQGAIQIRFVTRQGTNDFHGSAYWYYRSDKLNANTWFNNRDLPPDPVTGKAPQAKLTQNQPGLRVGGPIVIPGLFNGRDKAFFFINYEEFRQPSDVTRQRIILSPSAQQGVFRYSAAGGLREVNLLQLAAANGQTATADPVIAKLLSDIRASTGTTGGVADLADPIVQRYTYQVPFRNVTRYPTVRLDFNLTNKHRLTASYSLNKLLSDPDTLNARDPQFPGFPVGGVQDSKREAYQGSLRSTLTQNMVNELRFFGRTGGATLFSTEINPSMWKGTSVADQAGYQLNLNGACCGSGQALTNASSSPNLSAREAGTKVVSDTLNWVKGSHNLAFGAEFTQADVWLWNQTQVPTVNFGIATGDPADALFNATNFPGASTTQLNNARALYAILTGRVLSITGNARLDANSNQYAFLGPSRAEGRLREFDFFVQDSWRWKPSLTLNFGLRYVLQLPFYPLNDSFSTATLEDVWGVSGVGNLFEPGVLTGKTPTFQPYKKGQRAYNIDWNNFAPNLGLTWRPTFEGGVLRAILGSEPVFRGAYAIAYSRNGMGDFTGLYNANPGIQIDASRSQTLGNLGPVPLLFRDQSRLGPPSFASTPVYPMRDVITQETAIFAPDYQVPYSQTWMAGIQRALGKNMWAEARYIGTRGLQQGGIEYNYNEANIVENGFLNEFRLAQANLQANIAAGRGNTFRYAGPGTGTSPLPIYLAYFSGIPASRAGDPSLYGSANWSSTNFINPLAALNPQPFVPAGISSTQGLDGDSTRRANAVAAGLPRNFFRVNPDQLGGAFIIGNGGYTRYDAFEFEMRRRYYRGFQFQTSYTFGKAYESNRFSLRLPRVKRNNGGDIGGVTHGFKFSGIWDLPFGKGRRFASDAGGVLNRIVGGWSLAGTARIQSGRMLNFGNVRMVGFNEKDLRKMFKLRFDDAGKKVYMLPQDVIDNTIKAFSVSATSPTGYGAQGPPSGRYFAPANGPDCIEMTDPTLPAHPWTGGTQFGYNYGIGTCGAGSVVVTGPAYKTFDLSLVKKIPLSKGINLEFRAELLNALNHANFVPVTGGGAGSTAFSTASGYEVTSTYDAGRIAQLVGRITW